MKKIFSSLFFFVLLFVICFILSVRFGDLQVKDGEKIILGYEKGQKEFIINDYQEFGLKSIDGPYIYDEGTHYKIIRVEEKNGIYQLATVTKPKDAPLEILVKVSNDDKDEFKLSLSKSEEIKTPPATTLTNSKIIAISDIEGNFNGFSSFLKAQKVIDENFHWTFGDGHLVLVGDFMDRGKNVLPVLWLIYKLEKEAAKEGGGVHFILGNHEAMNFCGDLRYVAGKYSAFGQACSKDEKFKPTHLKMMNDPKFLLGNWLKSKNVIERINEYLFVHGGISPELLAEKLTMDEINVIARKNLHKDLYGLSEKMNSGDHQANLIMGRKGPMWYRGFSYDYKSHYKKMTPDDFTKVLNQFDVRKIIIGHSVVKDIYFDRNNSLINIDLRHGQHKNSGKTKGILIEAGEVFVVDDKGDKKVIKAR